MNYLNEASLIEGLKREESTAFKYLYQDNFNTVAYYIRQNSGDSDDAKDIFQESLIALVSYVRKPDFKFSTNVGGFLVSIAKKMWLYRLRQTRPHQSTDDIDSADEGADDFQFFENPANIKEEKLNAITLHLGNIGEECKKLLMGFYYKNASMKDLATEMGYTDAFIRVKKNRCMNALKEKISGN